MRIAYTNGDNGLMDATDVQSHRLRRVHRLLFSLSLALGILLSLEFRPYDIFLPIFRLEDFFSHQLGLRGSGISAYLAFFLCALLLTASLFLLLWCFRRRPIAEYILLFAGGFTALGVAPVVWLYIKSPYPRRWYPAELAVYLGFALLYLLQKWTIPKATSIVIVALHFGFWFLRFWEYEANPLELLMPIIGFCACLAWVLYVHTEREQSFQASPSATPSRF